MLKFVLTATVLLDIIVWVKLWLTVDWKEMPLVFQFDSIPQQETGEQGDQQTWQMMFLVWWGMMTILRLCGLRAVYLAKTPYWLIFLAATFLHEAVVAHQSEILLALPSQIMISGSFAMVGLIAYTLST